MRHNGKTGMKSFVPERSWSRQQRDGVEECKGCLEEDRGIGGVHWGLSRGRAEPAEQRERSITITLFPAGAENFASIVAVGRGKQGEHRYYRNQSHSDLVTQFCPNTPLYSPPPPPKPPTPSNCHLTCWLDRNLQAWSSYLFLLWFIGLCVGHHHTICRACHLHLKQDFIAHCLTITLSAFRWRNVLL